MLTPGYGRLLAALGTVTGTDVATQRALNGLVGLELQQRVTAFESARKALGEQIQRWAPLGAFVVGDTSVYIEHEKKLEELDLAALVDAEGDLMPVHLLVPVVVLDELDGLKNRAPTQQVKWRAAYTLGVFDRIFIKGTGPRMLRPAKPRPGPPVPRYGPTVEIVFDPPGHARLPINDDELVDQTVAIQALAERPVTLVTFDTGMSMRARAAGLSVIKLTRPIGEEPTVRRKKSSAD